VRSEAAANRLGDSGVGYATVVGWEALGVADWVNGVGCSRDGLRTRSPRLVTTSSDSLVSSTLLLREDEEDEEEMEDMEAVEAVEEVDAVEAVEAVEATEIGLSSMLMNISWGRVEDARRCCAVRAALVALGGML